MCRADYRVTTLNADGCDEALLDAFLVAVASCAPPARLAERGAGRGRAGPPRGRAAARVRRRGAPAPLRARRGRRGSRVPAPGGGMRRVVPRPLGRPHPREAEDHAPDGGRAHVRRHASGREGRADRRPAREGALVADGGRRRPGDPVVPRTHDQRRRPERRGADPRPGSHGAGVQPRHRDAESAARVHEGRLRRPHARPRVEPGVRRVARPRAGATSSSRPRSSGRCASWPRAGSTSRPSRNSTRWTSGRATKASCSTTRRRSRGATRRQATGTTAPRTCSGSGSARASPTARTWSSSRACTIRSASRSGPTATPDEVLELCERLNPDRIPGRPHARGAHGRRPGLRASAAPPARGT